MIAVSEKDIDVNYCSHFRLLQPPFIFGFDSSKFYGGANRTSVLEDIVIKIQRDDACIYLEAEAGSGKTAICRMIERELDDTTCLYVNCAEKNSVPFEKQMAQGLLLDTSSFLPLEQLENALLEKLEDQTHLVVMCEGITGLSSEQFSWMARVQDKFQLKDKYIGFLFLYSTAEKALLPEHKFSQKNSPLHLLPLTEYETYEFLNLHMYLCGAKDITLFPRDIAVAIANESGGNFSKIADLANKTLRSSYKRGGSMPTVKDLPFVSKTTKNNVNFGFALETILNTMIVGTIAGSAALLLMWSFLGSLETTYPTTKIGASDITVVSAE